MKISARNVFEGSIRSVKEGPISAEVEMVLGSGELLVAEITEGSVQALGIAPGRRVAAIVKAPLVMLATDTTGWRFTARNQLQGTVAAVERGSVNARVTVTLASGAMLASVVTNSAVEDLGLTPGSAVTAMFKASSVLLGLPG